MLCEAVDNLDHGLAEEVCYELYKRPPLMHQMASYQLEKIFSYLGYNHSPNAPSDVIYGLQLAKYFPKDSQINGLRLMLILRAIQKFNF